MKVITSYPDATTDLKTFTFQFMRHGLHADDVAFALEIDRFQMLRCQPCSANDLLLCQTIVIDLCLSFSYGFRFVADRLETVGVIILCLGGIVGDEEHTFTLNEIPTEERRDNAVVTCCFKWFSNSIAPGKMFGKFQITPSQSKRNVSLLFSRDLACGSVRYVHSSLDDI